MKKFLLSLALLASCASAQTGEGQKGKATAPAPAATPAAAPARVDAAQLLGDVRVLSSDAMEGRGAGTPGGARARAYVLGRFAQIGLRPDGESFEQPFALRNGSRGVNVVGHIAGRGRSPGVIVVTAHYDHLGVRGGQIYNGADDNASGVAALLQLAAHFAREQPEHTLLFAALDSEESGLQGAYALVAALKKAGRAVALNVNLDMVSRGDRGALHAAGAHHTPALRPHLERVAASAPVKLLLGHDRPGQGRDDWTNQSDHFAFHREKIPFVYFGVEDHKDYHRPSDDFEAIDADFYTRAVETILSAVIALDRGLAGAAND